MRIFGGKIKNVQTDVNKKEFFYKKLAHAYYKRPYFCKFFGWKIKNFEKGLPLEVNLASQDNFSENI